MRPVGLLLAACAFAASHAQVPDIVPIVELRPTAISSDGESSFRWYDGMGRHSLVGFQLRLEPGYRALVTQRLQRVPGDADSETLDEAYVEDPGLWRVGRQLAPFGANRLIREYLTAGRFETKLVFAELPVHFAAGDNGVGRARGISARVGRSFGVSVAAGNHFGVAATSLCPIRRPEESSGKGRGYRLILGADARLGWGKFSASAEYASLRDPDADLDPREEVSDLLLAYGGSESAVHLQLGWARAWRSKREVLRAEAEVRIDPRVRLVAFIRMPSGGRNDLAIGARVKI